LIVSILIIVVSLALFSYWFRYTCVLILSAKTSRDYAAEIANANQLRFLETRTHLLRGPKAIQLDQVYESLDRDYTLITYLLRHASARLAVDHSLENHILMIDFRLMSAWYGIVHKVSRRKARGALLEMSSIVGHLANTMGERVSTTF
jgi:hypothetical protein